MLHIQKNQNAFIMNALSKTKLPVLRKRNGQFAFQARMKEIKIEFRKNNQLCDEVIIPVNFSLSLPFRQLHNLFNQVSIIVKARKKLCSWTEGIHRHGHTGMVAG